LVQDDPLTEVDPTRSQPAGRPRKTSWNWPTAFDTEMMLHGVLVLWHRPIVLRFQTPPSFLGRQHSKVLILLPATSSILANAIERAYHVLVHRCACRTRQTKDRILNCRLFRSAAAMREIWYSSAHSVLQSWNWHYCYYPHPTHRSPTTRIGPTNFSSFPQC